MAPKGINSHAPKSIDLDVQLLVEGNDERNFFEAFIEDLDLAKTVQIQVFDGKDQLHEFLPALAGATGFRDVKSIGIVRDADDSADAAFQSVRTCLTKAELPVPDHREERVGERPSVSVLILPGGGADGMLETLLCKTFAGGPVDRCIQGFFRCVEESGSSIHRPDKARVRAYLATTRDPHASAGVAAKKGHWPLAHAAFNGVRRFLRSLVQGQPAP